MSNCPINYDWENCSSKEYGYTCDTCYHWKKDIDKQLEYFLIKTNSELLHSFKWGSQGESEFNLFMRLVKEEINKSNK